MKTNFELLFVSKSCLFFAFLLLKYVHIWVVDNSKTKNLYPLYPYFIRPFVYLRMKSTEPNVLSNKKKSGMQI